MGNAAGKHKPGGSKNVHWDNAVTPAPPGKPQLVPGTPHTQPDLVTIRWEPPVNNGGAPITGYLVEHRRTGSPHWVRSTPALVTAAELTLSGLEPGWRYQFRVSAQNGVGMSEPGDVSEPLTVTLNRSAAAAPHFVQELHDTIALENETAEFKVYFRGTPTPKVAWYKEGFEIFSSRRMRVVTEGDQSSLVIFQTAFSDEGEIKCTATNRVGHVVSRAKLRLEAPPSIRLPRPYEDGLLFEMGEIIRMKVSVAGRPLPRVTWFHNGEQVVFGGRYEVANTDRSSSIRVGEARRADRGEYQVRATNRLGEDLVSFLVTVTDRPMAPGKARVVTTLGRSITLSWSMPEDDGGCKIGNYIVEYYRIGWNVWLKAATCRQLSTTLGDLIEGSEYKFRVKAENPYGVSEPSEESDVVFIPDPKRGLLEPPARKKGSRADIQNEDKKKSKPGSGRTIEDKQQTPLTKKDAIAANTRKELESKVEAAKKGGPDMRLIRSREWETVDRPVPVIMYENNKPPEAVKRKNKENMEKRTVETGPKLEGPELKKAKEEKPPPVPPKTVRKPVQAQVQPQTQEMAVPKSKPTPARKQGMAEGELRRASLGDKAGRSHFLSPNSPLTPREDDDSILHGSSELMLVLLPHTETGDGDIPREERAQSERPSEYGITFQESESLVAPPMSLSAPELGSGESVITNPLRNAVSSTELLHEKAMARFYQAVAAEEAEKARQRRQSIERVAPTPARVRLASLENEEEVRRVVRARDIPRARLSSLEDEEDLRQTLKGRISQNPPHDKPTNQQNKGASAAEFKPKPMLERTGVVRLSTEEEEQEEFARLRQRLNSGEGVRQTKERVRAASEEEDDFEEESEEEEVEEEEEDFEDEESLDASVEYDDDEDEPYHPRSFLAKTEVRPKLDPPFISLERDAYSDEEEEETYHPRNMIPRKVVSPPVPPHAAVQPQIIPKPILKQSKQIHLGDNQTTNLNKFISPAGYRTSLSGPSSDSVLSRSSKSPSPAIDTGESDVVVRRRKKEAPPIESPGGDKSGKEEAELHDDDVGLSAAEMARKRRMQARQSSLEEEATLQKVVSCHYDDFIREYGRPKKPPIQLYTNTEELKAAAYSSGEDVNTKEPVDANEELADTNENVPTVYQEYEERWQKLQQKQQQLEQQRQQKHIEEEEVKNQRQQKEEQHRKQQQKQQENEKQHNMKDDEEDEENEEDEEDEEEERATKTKRWWWWFWWKRGKTEDEPSTETAVPPVVEVEISPPPAPSQPRSVTPEPVQRSQSSQENDRMKVAEKNVRSFMEYMSDLAMFSVACSLYVLENEVLAIPVLILMVYRQVGQAIKKRIPARWRRSR